MGDPIRITLPLARLGLRVWLCSHFLLRPARALILLPIVSDSTRKLAYLLRREGLKVGEMRLDQFEKLLRLLEWRHFPHQPLRYILVFRFISGNLFFLQLLESRSRAGIPWGAVAIRRSCWGMK